MLRSRHSFELKLLTSTKEVNLRRLRSYAVSLGGGASLFHDYDELLHHLNQGASSARNAPPEAVLSTSGNQPVDALPHISLNVILIDGTLVLKSEQITALEAYGRVFVLQNPNLELSQGRFSKTSLPPSTAPHWNLESYLLCSLTSYLESPVVRISMAHMMKSEHEFHTQQLLRWGHMASTCSARAHDLSAHAQQFTKTLSLNGEGRRLTEMFSHFVQTSLSHLNLNEESVTFGSDGLLVAGIVRCRPFPQNHTHASDEARSSLLQKIVEELRVNNFQIGIVNQVSDGCLEIAGLYHLFAPVELAGEHIVLVFNKRSNDAMPQALAPLHRAS